jgi:carbon-monoxide dehydrogenase large subunit
VLGVEPGQVRLMTGDSDRVLAGGGSASARSMRLGSWVIAKAADAIVDKGRRIAGAMLEAAEEDIEFARQRFVIKGLIAASVCSRSLPGHSETAFRPICEGR